MSLFSIILANPALMSLIIFGNIENLILSSQGVVAKVDPLKLGLLSIAIVIIWLIIGTLASNALFDYIEYIDFIGGLAIFILGIDSMYGAIKPHLNKN